MGTTLTTTFVLVDDEHELPSVTVTKYVPPLAVVALGILGFWRLEENPFGPDHVYVFPPPEDNEIVPPTQTGELLDAVAMGLARTVT
jgi:hypothetical protein